ncbi:MAG TPA: hypothetical protein VM241_06790 [Candidatus Thermoplasmatota archaeon]|nr:hypothetical protein [Candidatus Thermoplasmatota archaeon]
MQLTDTDPRRQRGADLLAAKGDLIKKLPNRAWLVPSQSDDGAYRVKAPGQQGRVSWQCTCKDHLSRGAECKHIWAIRLVLSASEPAAPSPVVEARVPVAAPAAPALPGIACKHCRGREVTRYGLSGKKPAYWCKPCGRKFVVDDGFKGLKGDAKVVTLALDLYFKGVSLRQIADTLEQFFSVRWGMSPCSTGSTATFAC